MSTIIAIKASDRDTLYIKDIIIKDNRVFCKYKSTYNTVPFTETELFLVDNGTNLVITGTNGAVLFRFSVKWLSKVLDDE